MSDLRIFDNLEAQLGRRTTLAFSLDDCARRTRATMRTNACTSLAFGFFVKLDVESLWPLGLL